ncbi:hypothetical protein ACKZDW_20370 [Ralstonia syzygii subsp. celebesensis]|uniref:Uncharacterized protein n=2 Tax=Ralstonia syzygii subsp. celebesensis TaxID=1310168 RepID=A0A1U9VFU7_9RALS|nr:hypothetical protein [Ralstonia syzygii]AQW29550.1 hypothetical protein B0B51_05805 [blood disease bacterium A2-HR MARDI]QQV56579.1 hypothetical protein JK151_06345 [Ralstonia syzygii subsp. celebesensis]CCA79935.1 conserved hypothetical protein [blood disease bacterium R229]
MLIGLTGADGVSTVTAADHLCLHHRFTQFPLAELRACWMLADDAVDPTKAAASLSQLLGDLADVDAVVTGVRFEIEASMIRERGGVIVRIEHPGAPRVIEHANEAGIRLHDGDRVLHNYGTFFHLYDQLDTLVNTLQFERAGA